MRVLVTGCGGLVGSRIVLHFEPLSAIVWGLDNDLRGDFFGPDGSTRWNVERLQQRTRRFRHAALDIRCRSSLEQFFRDAGPFDLIVHCAAQPSHDLSARRLWDDFDVNAVGTVNLLELTRRWSADAVFVFLSSNKVYGDAPNQLPLVELPARYDFARPQDQAGIDESMRIDMSLHSPFGVSKAAADLMVQEFGRYFGLSTVCLRGGCLTGAAHSGVELHGFLSYLVRTHHRGDPYHVFGYQGKQVRDNLHSDDIATLVECIYRRPRQGEVYNLGGGRDNSCSILEAFDRLHQLSGRQVRYDLHDTPRIGDHQCYITNLSKVRAHYPEWSVSRSLESIFEELWSHAERGTPESHSRTRQPGRQAVIPARRAVRATGFPAAAPQPDNAR